MINIETFKNSNIVSFKLMKKEYAEHSFNNCEMYFSCAANYAKINKKGQGDPEEGLYARVYKDRKSYIRKQIRIYGDDLLLIPNGDFVDLKLKSIINMPTFCLFSIKGKDREVSANCREQYYLKKSKEIFKTQFKIDKRLFLDFIDTKENKSNSNICILNYISLRLLIEQVKNSFDFLGYDKNQIINRNITYIDRTNCEWICKENHPYELFYKSKEQFEHQHEYRILLTDKKVNLIDKEENKYFKLKVPNLKRDLEYRDLGYVKHDMECCLLPTLSDKGNKEITKQEIKQVANILYEITNDKMYFYISDMIK